MPNSVTPTDGSPSGYSVTIETLSANWLSTTHHPSSKMRVLEVEFYPGAAYEYIIIRRDSLTGQKELKLHSLDGGPVHKIPKGIILNPCIAIADCSVASGTAMVVIRYTNRLELNP